MAKQIGDPALRGHADTLSLSSPRQTSGCSQVDGFLDARQRRRATAVNSERGT